MVCRQLRPGERPRLPLSPPRRGTTRLPSLWGWCAPWRRGRRRAWAASSRCGRRRRPGSRPACALPRRGPRGTVAPSPVCPGGCRCPGEGRGRPRSSSTAPGSPRPWQWESGCVPARAPREERLRASPGPRAPALRVGPRPSPGCSGTAGSSRGRPGSACREPSRSAAPPPRFRGGRGASCGEAATAAVPVLLPSRPVQPPG